MPDPRFHTRSGPLALEEIALRAGVDVPAAAKNLELSDVAPLDTAGPGDLSFLDNVKYRDMFAATKAGACLVREEYAALAPAKTIAIVTADPYKAYARAAQLFYPDALPPASIHPTARVDTSATLGKSCVVEEGAVIKPGAVLGANCHVGPLAVIGANVQIGEGCRIGASASVSHALIGDHVHIYPGARIGQDGFGFAPDPGGHVKIPQLGRVVIESGVEIGANTCIDRGSGPDTVIGTGTWIDNLCQIGHNVKIGKGCIIVAQVGIAGSTTIGDFSALGGQVGITGHLKIGRNVRAGAQTGIIQDVPDGAEIMGYPAVPIRSFMRQAALLKRLIRKG